MAVPQAALPQQRIIQPNPGAHCLPRLSPYESTTSHPLPYRVAHGQRKSNTLLPIQRAYPIHQPSAESQKFQSSAARVIETHTTHRSEHMLRRKTPNGTLAAGYDGTPVRWSTKPPAAKHIVLPVSRAPTKEKPLLKADPHILDQSEQGIYEMSRNRQPTRLPARCVIGGPNGTSVDWTRLPPLIGVSNSIFDSIYMHQAPTYFLCDGNAMQVPTVLQPPCQPCSGPTSSNDGGFYGPYWPNGKFVPYRPAATRHIAYSNLKQREASQPKTPYFGNENFTNCQQNDVKFPGGDDFDHSQRISGVGAGGGNSVDVFSSRSHFSGRQQITLLEPLGTQSPRPPGMYDPTLLTGKHQTQFKEKALIWAHGVYVELLTYLQHTRKGSQYSKRPHGLGRSYSQANIYLKPPRQSSFSSLVRPSVDFYGKTESRSASMHNVVVSTGRRSSLPITSQMEQKQSSGNSGTVESARYALEMLTNLCQESGWRWIDGMLLGGCLAYGLEDYHKALDWYTKIISIDPSHVEGISNLAATLLSLNRREEAEQYWLQSVKLRPSYFEAVEHLIGLLCAEQRGGEAVGIIEFVERSLRSSTFAVQQFETNESSFPQRKQHQQQISNPSTGNAVGWSTRSEPSLGTVRIEDDVANHSGFGSSGYAIPGSENGRMLALVHAKGNMLYTLGDITGAEHAFEDAVLIGAGRRLQGIRGLIQKILNVLSMNEGGVSITEHESLIASPLLLPPDKALQTAKLVFTRDGELPGLRFVPEGVAKNIAISTTSNSLLSLAKIFQDGMSNTQSLRVPRRPSGVGDILALYYLSLSLQPSPSTANNVGILLASVQQAASAASKFSNDQASIPAIPGVIPGSGIALALAYYNYGLNLDSRHAHLYTNLGSLLKDIGQLTAAIKMYEQAVACDSNFDIALANLANAVKDQGRISDAIGYYKRAVNSSPDFAEAVCGLANALNSVCDWTGRGGALLEGGRLDRWHVDDKGMLCDAEAHGTSAGWMQRVVEIVGKQLEEGANWGRGILQDQVLQSILRQLEVADSGDGWSEEKHRSMRATLCNWAGKVWEGARIVRLVERAMKRAMHRWYQDKFVLRRTLPRSSYSRPQLPTVLSIPGAPTVLPFHTFTCPLSAKEIRMISQRNALRISCSTLRAPWLPISVYTPPPPPKPYLNIGYVSSDFNNHPLAHLMQSVFGLHDSSIAKAFCYATTASDHSVHREQIEREAPVFRDSSNWSSDMLVQQIVKDEIHILVNLNGYTRGARNEVFAARPAPIQMSFMGFAGTLGAEWCDYLLADETAIPPETLRPWRRNVELEDQLCDDQCIEDEDWVYSENIIFCRDTFFCCDHRQSSPDPQIPWQEEQKRRWQMRNEIFPNLSDDAIILGNFNQLYKIEPTTFRTWLRILARVPKAILWLLRFPDLGESNLKRTARLWAGEEVASRLWFTDVAPKNQHISRARVCDLFLDTPECNAHTTAADVLWSATPLLTLPRYKYKMCSRMAASILRGALPKTFEGKQAALELIAGDENQYEQFAVRLASGLTYDRSGTGAGRLSEIRKLLYESRSTCALFDTKRWVSDLELAYQEAWRRWVDGVGGDIYL